MFSADVARDVAGTFSIEICLHNFRFYFYTLSNREATRICLKLQGLSVYSDCHDNVAGLKYQGAVSIRKTVLPGVAIPMLKIRRPNGRLIFNIGIAMPR